MKSISDSNRVIIKIGSSLLINKGSGINAKFLDEVVEDISSLKFESSPPNSLYFVFTKSIFFIF